MDLIYSKVSLKSGLEIHQQLDTGKLFSRTPSLLRSDFPHYEIKRKLHKIAGETGEIDAAVQHEASLDKEFIYQGYNDTISLVELDESPPQEIDRQALDEALKIALLLNCEIYPVSQIMRKTVIDGSNTSGFQRTVLIAHSGSMDCSFGKVPIETVILEEDAARIVEKKENQTIYRLDRLGIPLVEIATSPVLDTPDKIKEAALKLGEILRACKVKRGIGTIRQDLNISIKGHNRVEIKGFQDPKLMIKTIDLEIVRQQEELKKGKIKGGVRNVLDDASTEFLRPIPGKARMYPETDLLLLKISRDHINKIKKNLPKLKHEIRDELKKKGLSDELINLVLDGNLDEFEILMRVYDKDANLIAKMITLWRQDLAAKNKKTLEEVKNILNENILESILEKVASKEISESDVRSIMIKIYQKVPLDEALKIDKQSDDQLEEKIRNIIKENPGLRPNAYMGLMISKLGKDVDKRKAMEILKRIVNIK
ncbi:hypothetical protein J4408_04050 [Candidatus Pacearchaeota archaeon]|nr:hypothetical protein [Candidatus Pacearchaeota archaeon]